MRRSVLLEKFIEVQKNLFNDIISEIKNDFFCYLIGHPGKKIGSILLDSVFADINATGDLIIWDSVRDRRVLSDLVDERSLFLMCIVDPILRNILNDDTLFDIRLFLDRYFNRCKEIISNKTVKKLKHLKPYITMKFPKNIEEASINSISPDRMGTIYLTVDFSGGAIIDSFNCKAFVKGEKSDYLFSNYGSTDKRVIICGDPVIFESTYKINYSIPRNGEILRDSISFKIDLEDSVYSLPIKDENSN